ncbi:hypothetical protein FRC10_000942 [Ceratobasidium sp. 414]|nr:hypothetical protein FRC10_000942 [Ceratobasidium sp. 414]
MHTDATLAAFKKAYQDFHKYKDVWIKNGARQGEKGNVINHFNILKLHVACHLPEQVKEKGTTDNYSTETVEHLHIDSFKEPYKATNKKEWERQVNRGLVWCDKLTNFGLWLDWTMEKLQRKRETERTRELSDLDGITPGSHPVTQSEHKQPTPYITPPYLAPPHPALNLALNKGLNQSRWVPVIARPLKKWKQMSDEEKEEQSEKWIKFSQQTYGLQPHQDITLEPLSCITVAELQQIYQIPGFLDKCRASTY